MTTTRTSKSWLVKELSHGNPQRFCPSKKADRLNAGSRSPCCSIQGGAGALLDLCVSAKADEKCMGLFIFFLVRSFTFRLDTNPLQCTLAHYHYLGVASARWIIPKVQFSCIYKQSWVKCGDCLGMEIINEVILNQTQFLCLLNMKYFGSLGFIFVLKWTLSFHLDHLVCFSEV